MSGRTDDELSSKTDGVVIPRIWVTLALSVLIHVAALWELPPIAVKLPGSSDVSGDRPRLSINLVPPAPPAPAARPAPPQPPPQAQAPKAAPRPKPPAAPPIIALKKPQVAKPSPTPAPTPPPAPAPKPTPPAIAGDMESYIAARRAARGAPPTPPATDPDARSKSIVAGNLDSVNNRTFGYDPNRGGGVFQVERLAYDHAEFIFYGWNKDIRRNTKQLIDVRKGDAADIRIAVVRKMVSIIREYEEEDFLWVSQRLGRSLMLSARPRDRAGLEQFMMQEFFPEFERMQR